MAAHKAKCQELGLTGRVLIAPEGVNATLEGTPEATAAYKAFLTTDPVNGDLFKGLKIKESVGTGNAFPKLSVKVRKEIVTLGAGEFDVEKETAHQLRAAELEQWYKNGEDFVVLDLRNDYEIASGKFEKTIDPGLANFRDLTTKLATKDPVLEGLKDKKVLTVCTGGIRCEKATCLLKREGFTNVYQLKDGIHTYMEEYPASHFKGTLFVFDNRMTTDVVPTEIIANKKEVVGTCMFCGVSTEHYCSDDSVRPSRKILCCPGCFEERKDALRSVEMSRS